MLCMAGGASDPGDLKMHLIKTDIDRIGALPAAAFAEMYQLDPNRVDRRMVWPVYRYLSQHK